MANSGGPDQTAPSGSSLFKTSNVCSCISVPIYSFIMACLYAYILKLILIVSGLQQVLQKAEVHDCAGTPKTINFPFVPNGKLMGLGVLTFKLIRVLISCVLLSNSDWFQVEQLQCHGICKHFMFGRAEGVLTSPSFAIVTQNIKREILIPIASLLRNSNSSWSE